MPLETVEQAKTEIHKLLKERKELQDRYNNREAEAQSVYNLIFKEKFSEGGKWLERTKKLGRRNALVVNLLGGVRHLYGYLHSERHVQSAMDRRAPNSIIQGPSSNLGFVGGYLVRKTLWNFFESRGIYLNYIQCNTIHDSTEQECAYINIPLVNYIADHAYSTLLHRWMRDVMHFETTISFEMDSKIAASLSEFNDETHMRWDEQVAAIEKGIKWGNENLGWDEPLDLIMPVVQKNAKIISKIRRHEIKRQLRNNDQVNYYMFMNKKNCLKLGLIFETPTRAAKKKGWEKELD